MIEIGHDEDVKTIVMSKREQTKILEKVKEKKPFISHVCEKLKDFDDKLYGINTLGEASYKKIPRNIRYKYNELVSYDDIKEVVEKYDINLKIKRLNKMVKSLYLYYLFENETNELRKLLMENKLSF